MNYLIDTNIISEVRKGERCDPNVARWYASIPDASLHLSVLVLGEIRKGLERIRGRDAAQARALENWLAAVAHAFAGRIFPVDDPVAEEWGRMNTSALCPRSTPWLPPQNPPDDLRHPQHAGCLAIWACGC